MRNRKIWMITCGIFFTSAILTGCKLVRDVDLGQVNIATPTPTGEVVSPTQTPKVTMEPTEHPVTIVVEHEEEIDLEGIVSYFYGMDTETLLSERYMEKLCYKEYVLGYEIDKNGIIINYNHKYDIYAGEAPNFFTMKDMFEGVGDSYRPMCNVSLRYTQKFVEIYPEIDLESCTRETAIEACAPLAQICGYGDAQVKAYAVTEDYLENYSSFWDDIGGNYSAPKPDYEYVSQRDIDIAIENGDEELANQLKYKKTYKQCKNVKWGKEHEAYILVYSSVLNGRVLEDREYDMCCIYVPKYGRVVYALVNQPLMEVKGLEETELMTEEDAIVKTLRFLGVESLEDVTITGCNIVYDAEYTKVNNDVETWQIDPCWKVDYILSNSLLEKPVYQDYHKYSGTVVINAVDGRLL